MNPKSEAILIIETIRCKMTYKQLLGEEDRSHLPFSTQLQDAERNLEGARPEDCYVRILSVYRPSF